MNVALQAIERVPAAPFEYNGRGLWALFDADTVPVVRPRIRTVEK